MAPVGDNMNWLQKISGVPIRTEDIPQKLAQAIQYACGGEWEAGSATPWTEDLEKITGDRRLGQEVGYSTSFWVTCKTGDGMYGEKWGISVNFTITSGSSNTVIDSETGGWDFGITVSVQSAYPSSWTPESPYALMSNRHIGYKEDIRTIEEVALFVKASIQNDQRDDEGDDDDDPLDPEPEPEPDPGLYENDPVFEDELNVRDTRIRGIRR